MENNQLIPKFKIGQKVVPISKTMQPFRDSIDNYLSKQNPSDASKHLKEHGYLSIIYIIFKDDSKSHNFLLDINKGEEYFYLCGDAMNIELNGDYFLEKDLVAYQEYEESLNK